MIWIVILLILIVVLLCQIGKEHLTENDCYFTQGNQKYFYDQTCENGGLGCNLFGKKLLRLCGSNGIQCPSKSCETTVVTKQKRIFEFFNNSDKVIYIASLCDPTKDIQKEIVPNGWKMNPKEIKNIEIDSNLTSIRFWARTECTNDQNGMITCQTGNCPLPKDLIATSEQGIKCNGIGGIPPATLIEFSLSTPNQGNDFYDISLVDGHNLNVVVIPSSYTSANLPANQSKFNCGSPSCIFDKNQCPEELILKDKYNNYMGCMSLCSAINNEQQRSKFPKLNSIYNGITKEGKPMKNLVCCSCGNSSKAGCRDPNSDYCCSPYDQLKTKHGGICKVEEWPTVCSLNESYCKNGNNDCDSSERLCIINGVKTVIPFRYDRVFKNSCPDAYSWQFDDLNSTYQCSNSNYTIIFY
jgi:hypothetical protein